MVDFFIFMSSLSSPPSSAVTRTRYYGSGASLLFFLLFFGASVHLKPENTQVAVIVLLIDKSQLSLLVCPDCYQEVMAQSEDPTCEAGRLINWHQFDKQLD
jgi:hypothetical protein